MYLETYPSTRLRRLRSSNWVRNIVSEVSISSFDLIQPVFTIPGKSTEEAVEGLPGIKRMTTDLVGEYAVRLNQAGIQCLLILPCVHQKLKTVDGREALNADGLLGDSVKAIKDACPEIGVMGDIALDLYTSHGHDGILVEKTGIIANDATISVLTQQALMQASIGVDVLAPSDMMDGRVGAIRQALEADGYSDTLVFPHSAKFASGLYGPYRGAVRSDQNLGKRDKRTYQQNPANLDEALREVRLDLTEGADGIIAKPGSLYFDVIREIKNHYAVPIIGFHVSGEFAMLKLGAEAGLLDYRSVLMETMTGFKRAGCSAVVTYAALEIAEQFLGA